MNPREQRGVKTNIVTAVRILDKDAADSPQFSPLVKETAKEFTVSEVSADKAYASLENFETVAGFGGDGLSGLQVERDGRSGWAFREDAALLPIPPGGLPAPLPPSQQRRKYVLHDETEVRGEVRSKTDVAMVNEVLCKVLCTTCAS